MPTSVEEAGWEQRKRIEGTCHFLQSMGSHNPACMNQAIMEVHLDVQQTMHLVLEVIVCAGGDVRGRSDVRGCVAYLGCQ